MTEQNEALGEVIKVTISSHDDYVNTIELLAPAYDSLETLPTGNEDAEIDNEGARGFIGLAYGWEQTCLAFFRAFPMMQHVASFVHMNHAREGIAQYVKDSAIDVETSQEEGGNTESVYTLSKEHLYKVTKSIEELHRYQKAEKAITKAQLLALIAEYEAFIADLLRIIIQIQPEAFFSKDATISVYGILKGENLSELKRDLIEERILSLQRESCVDQIKFIFEKLKIAEPDAISMREFAEICERRNLLTHNNGKVNNTYISKLEKLGYKREELPEIGHDMKVDDHYMMRSVARIFQMGYFTMHLVWQKLCADQREISVKYLINCSHEFLLNELTKMSRRVSQFTLNPKSPASERDRAIATINLALSYFLDKKLNKDARSREVEKVLATRDWSIVNAQFSLALCCLREKYEDLPRLIDAAVSEGVSRHSFLTWALFSKARELPEFKQKMQQHFGVLIDSSI